MTSGLAAFETLRTYEKKFFRLGAHLDRLTRSAALLGLATPPLETIRAELAAAALPNHRVRYTLTADGNRVMAAAPIDGSRIGAPISCARIEALPGLPAEAKHCNRAAWLLAARARGADEVLLVGRDGRLLEANRSNVFAAIGGALYTPPLDGRILAGVTRGALIDAAREAGLPLIEAPVPADAPFDELYVSSTLKELSPVDRLDGAPGPGGGPLGASLYAAFRALVARETAG